MRALKGWPWSAWPALALLGLLLLRAPRPASPSPSPLAGLLEDDYFTHPKYSFKYGVTDHQTGDIKSAQESRDGDAVRGRYSVLDADGLLRTVEYTADDRNGFRAVVSRNPSPLHPSNLAAHATEWE